MVITLLTALAVLSVMEVCQNLMLQWILPDLDEDSDVNQNSDQPSA